MFVQEIEKNKKNIVTQQSVGDVEALKSNKLIPARAVLQDVRVNTATSKFPIQMLSVFSRLSKEQKGKLVYLIGRNLTVEKTLSHEVLQGIIQQVAEGIRYDEDDLNALAAEYGFTIKDEAPVEPTEEDSIKQILDDESFEAHYDPIVTHAIQRDKYQGRFIATDGHVYYHKEGSYSSGGKPIWQVLPDGKVHICGMYEHPGENFRQYTLRNGDGPKSITIRPK